MADEHTDQPAPKSSDDLIRDARRASTHGRPGSGASEDLLREARGWLESGEMEAPPPATIAVRSTIDVPGIDEAAIEAEVARTLRVGTSPRPSARPTAQPATRPSRRRSRIPIPSEPADPRRPQRSRKRVLSLAVGIGVAVLVANVAGVLFAESQSDDQPSPTISTVPLPVVEFSEGSITSSSDPCSGATVAGGLDATITYLPDPTQPEVSIAITGNGLEGSDGTSYDLDLYGSMVGTAGQTTFEFETDWMVMTREDGLDFLDHATVTIDIVDGRPDTWSYSSVGADCPG